MEKNRELTYDSPEQSKRFVETAKSLTDANAADAFRGAMTALAAKPKKLADRKPKVIAKKSLSKTKK